MRLSHLALVAPLLFAAVWPAQQVLAPAGDYAEELDRFRTLLATCQRGEPVDVVAMGTSADRLARQFGRTDAPPAAAHYAALDPEARAAGWQAYLEFRELWSRLAESNRETWLDERGALVGDLEEYLSATAQLADGVPHARGLSLRARIAVHDLEAGGFLGENERLLDEAWNDAAAALERFESCGVTAPTVEPLWSLGRIALLEERFGEASRHFEEVLELAERTRNDDFREHALLGLLLVARETGDAPRVQRLVARLATFRDARACWPLAREHALHLLHEDHAAEAARFLRDVIPAGEIDRRSWSLLLGLAHARLSEFGAARGLLERPDAASDEPFQLALASLALREGRAESVAAALDDETKLAYFTPHGEMFARSLLGEAHLVLGRPARAAEMLERALELAEHWEARLEEQRLLGDATATVMGEWVGLHAVARLAEALAELGRPLDAAAAIERAQSRALRAALGEDAPDASDVAAWAARYEHGLVTWVVGADASALAWVAPDGEAFAGALPRSRAELTTGVRRLREAALAGDDVAAQRLGEELCEELLPAALRARLAASPGGRLLFLLHGPLERLPLALLTIDGRALDELCAPLTLPGLVARRAEEPESGAFERWTLAGDPWSRAGEPLLPAAAAELAAVQRLRPGARVLSGEGLVMQAIEAALASNDCLHVATHAERESDEADTSRLESVGLLLSNGERLSAPRVAALAPRSPLVVLAACATADGRFVDAEGLQGLARAFLESGTRNLLVTLWPVTDAAAAAFAEPYHEALLAGHSPSEAARLARVTLATLGFAAADRAAFRAVGRD